jgi:hypothetical protein
MKLLIAASILWLASAPLLMQAETTQTIQVKHQAVIKSDWMPSKAEAIEDAKKKALEKALNAYKIVDMTVRVKGNQRQVKIVIEY